MKGNDKTNDERRGTAGKKRKENTHGRAQIRARDGVIGSGQRKQSVGPARARARNTESSEKGNERDGGDVIRVDRLMLRDGCNCYSVRGPRGGDMAGSTGMEERKTAMVIRSLTKGLLGTMTCTFWPRVPCP